MKGEILPVEGHGLQDGCSQQPERPTDPSTVINRREVADGKRVHRPAASCRSNSASASARVCRD
eukprot:351002-Rhodomonas_salina.2